MQVPSAGGAGNAALIQQIRQQMFSRADKDCDGSLSLEEFQAQAKPTASAGTGAMDAAFKALDTDGDGKLGAAGMAKARPATMAATGRPWGRMGCRRCSARRKMARPRPAGSKG